MANTIGIFRGDALGSVAAACLLGCALMGAAGCKPAGQASAAAPADSTVIITLRPSETHEVTRSVDVVGTLWGDEDVIISAKVAGRVVHIARDVGDVVRANGMLAQIEKVDYELARTQKQMALQEALSKLGLPSLPKPGAFDPEKVPTVQRARLQAINAKSKYDRGKELHAKEPPLISEQDFADMVTAYQVAESNYDVEVLTARSLESAARTKQSELDQTQRELDDTTVRAPVDGEKPAEATMSATAPAGRSYAVAGRMVSVGEYVKVGQPLFRIIDDTKIKLRANVPERYISELKEEQVVEVSVEAYPRKFIGSLKRINPQVEPANRTFQIEVQIANPDRVLKAGGFARASVRTRIDRDVIFVPQECVITFAGTDKVFTVENSKAVEHVVTTGERLGDQLVEIKSGLGKAQQVVCDGASKLATGVPVKPRPAPATAK